MADATITVTEGKAVVVLNGDIGGELLTQAIATQNATQAAIDAAIAAGGDAAVAGALAGQEAALSNVGTTAGTLAAGDDARFNAVRFDTETSLTDPQKLQARENVGLGDDAVQNIALSAIEISPEDFYQTADAGDWAPAFARLETFRQALPNTGTRLIRVVLRKTRYYVKSPINLKVGTNHSLFMEGAGYLLDGSRIEVDPAWSGGTTPVLTIEGDSGAGTMGQFSLRGFAVTQTEGSGPAESGVVVKNLNGAAGGSPVRDLYIQGFKYPLTTTNARLIQWDRVYIWSRSITNAECIRIMSDGVGTFGGDMTFNECQTVAGVSGTYMSPNGSVGVSISAANGGETRGIRFNGYIGYHADTPVRIFATASATGGGTVADVWFNPGCQFDQTVVRPWDIQAQTGGGNFGTIFSVYFTGCYWSTVLGSHGFTPCLGSRQNTPNQINSNSGLVSEIHFRGCMIPNFSQNLFFQDVVGLHFVDNDLYGYGNPSVGLDAIVVLVRCFNVKMRGNVTRAATNNITYAVIVTEGGSIEIGSWAGVVTAVRDFGAIVRFETWGRPIIRGPLNVFADRAAAIAGGLTAGEVYETSAGALMRV